ncbi:hypothetical protein, partial [Limosilactobacillus reuteri]|uniref:hypothetical protein n=1 Tax=Limosilactobacillus reuteri TaxID=1598 RepID=UPI00207C9F76
MFNSKLSVISLALIAAGFVAMPAGAQQATTGANKASVNNVSSDGNAKKAGKKEDIEVIEVKS